MMTPTTRLASKGAAVELRNVRAAFRTAGGGKSRHTTVHAVNGVDARVEAGKTLGIVGESGCGKSTLGRCIVGTMQAEPGSEIWLGDVEICSLTRRARRSALSRVQLVYQDPYGSFDPRRSVGFSLLEVLKPRKLGLTRAEREERVREIAGRVSVDLALLRRLPSELSGGQLQRLNIARALLLRPDVLVLDEPVASLDRPLQRKVLSLLRELQTDLGLTYILITHDLTSLNLVAQDVAVLYLGAVVESGPLAAVFDLPQHPYTAALLSAVPSPDPFRERNRDRIVLTGDAPSPTKLPSGCLFSERCWLRTRLGNPDICTAERPKLKSDVTGAHAVACHFSGEVSSEGRPSSTVADRGGL